MRRGQRGFTLVEVLVTAALISVALAISAALVVTAMNSFARASRLNAAKQLGLAVYDYWENRLTTATAIALEGEAPPGWRTLASAGGRVEADGEALYPEAAYGGFQVAVSARGAGHALMLTVTVTDSGGAAFVKESAVILANTTAEATESTVIHYTIGDRV